MEALGRCVDGRRSAAPRIRGEFIYEGGGHAVQEIRFIAESIVETFVIGVLDPK